MSTQTVPVGELRTVALAYIHVQEGFNPRDRFERWELDRLTRSIAAHGVLQPLLVAPNGDGYRLVAGERRYRAAIDAGLAGVSVVVRGGETSGLDLAVIENIKLMPLPAPSSMTRPESPPKARRRVELALRRSHSRPNTATRGLGRVCAG